MLSRIFTGARAFAAVLLAILITGVFSMGGSLLAFIFGRTLFGNIFFWWACLMKRFVYDELFRTTIKIEATVRPLDPDETALVIANHPSISGAPLIAWFVTTYLTSRLCVVAKREHLWNPVGWILWATGAGIFVKRDDPEQSVVAIRRAFENGQHAQSAIILFPDMRRPSPERIAKDIKRFAGRIPFVERWLTHTLVPRGGGLHTVLQSFAGRRLRIINMTEAFNVKEYGLWDVRALLQATFHFRVEDVTSVIPVLCDRASLNAWLNGEWIRKNCRIELWREEHAP